MSDPELVEEIVELRRQVARLAKRREADHRGYLDSRRVLTDYIRRLEVRLAAARALLPVNGAEYAIFPFQLREALEAEEADFLLIPRSALHVESP